MTTSDGQMDLFKVGRRRSDDMRALLELEKAYTGHIALDANKVKDLMYMCSENIIPASYHEFYNNITSINNAVPSESEYESDDESDNMP